jgi:hypothetical protein
MEGRGNLNFILFLLIRFGANKQKTTKQPLSKKSENTKHNNKTIKRRKDRHQTQRKQT